MKGYVKMSDASHRWCSKCNQPEYACDCDDPELTPSLVSLLMDPKADPKDIERVKKIMGSRQ